MSQASQLIGAQARNGSIIAKQFGEAMYFATAYGIFPDGTDVTNKLQSLINLANFEGRSIIFFPAGEYKVTYINNDEKITFIGDNARFVGGYNREITQLGTQPKNNIVYNVKDYGAKGDGIADDYTKIQNLINLVQSSKYGGTIFFPKGMYQLGSGLKISIGSGYSEVTIEGDHSTLYYLPTNGSCININPTEPKGSTNYKWIKQFSINNLILDTGPYSTAKGLVVGKAGYMLDTFSFSQVNNLLIQSFDTGIEIVETRHISFTDVVVRSPVSRSLIIASDSTFCGDIIFYNCEFIAGSSENVRLYTQGTLGATGELRGIKFECCSFYGRGSGSPEKNLHGTANAYGMLTDIWVTACQFDQFTNTAISFDAGSNGRVLSIHIKDTYVVGGALAFEGLVTSPTDASGPIQIDGCTVAFVSHPFNFYNFSNVMIQASNFLGVTIKSSFSGVAKNIIVSNNIFNGSSYLPSQVMTLSGGVTSAIISNNFGNFEATSGFLENQTSLPATKIVNVNNIQSVL